MHQFKGVIFDLDGTIVDSKLNFDQMRKDIGIPKGEPILEYLDNHSDQNFIKNAHQIIHKHEQRGAEQSTLIKDFYSFYSWLKQHKIPMGVLTRNSKKITTMTLKKHQLEFDDILTRDCCPPKPRPDGLLIIAKKWEIRPQQLVYIGDFKFDLQTAKNAQMKSALILNTKNKDFRIDADIAFDFYNEIKKYFSHALS